MSSMFSKFTPAQQAKYNDYYGPNPVAGDYWHENGKPVRVVLEVGAVAVTYCQTRESFPSSAEDPGGWGWDLTKVEVVTKEKFNSGLIKEATGTYWADVNPQAHQQDVQSFLLQHGVISSRAPNRKKELISV